MPLVPLFGGVRILLVWQCIRLQFYSEGEILSDDNIFEGSKMYSFGDTFEGISELSSY